MLTDYFCGYEKKIKTILPTAVLERTNAVIYIFGHVKARQQALNTFLTYNTYAIYFKIHVLSCLAPSVQFVGPLLK